MTSTIASPVSLPPAPRALTRAGRRRSWHELGVQMWWKSALVVASVALIVAAGELQQGLRERSLLKHGVLVEGRLVRVGGVSEKDNRNWKMLRDQTIPVEISVKLPNAELTTLKGELPAGPGYLAVNGPIAIRIDAQNPSRWIEAREISPLWQMVAVPLGLLALSGLFILVALWQRTRKLRIWRDGISGQGVVVDARHTAVAPRSRVVRFTHADGQDKRVLSVLHPIRAGVPQPGQSLSLLHLPDRTGAVIVPELYMDR